MDATLTEIRECAIVPTQNTMTFNTMQHNARLVTVEARVVRGDGAVLVNADGKPDSLTATVPAGEPMLVTAMRAFMNLSSAAVTRSVLVNLLDNGDHVHAVFWLMLRSKSAVLKDNCGYRWTTLEVKNWRGYNTLERGVLRLGYAVDEVYRASMVDAAGTGGQAADRTVQDAPAIAG